MGATKGRYHTDLVVNKSTCVHFDLEKLKEALGVVEAELANTTATRKEYLAFKLSKKALVPLMKEIADVCGQSMISSKSVQLDNEALKTLAEAPEAMRFAYDKTKKRLLPQTGQIVREFLDGVDGMVKENFAQGDPAKYYCNRKKLTK